MKDLKAELVQAHVVKVEELLELEMQESRARFAAEETARAAGLDASHLHTATSKSDWLHGYYAACGKAWELPE